MKNILITALLLLFTGCGDKKGNFSATLLLPGYGSDSTNFTIIIDIYDIQVGLECDNRPENTGKEGGGNCKFNYSGEDTEVEITTGEKFVDVLLIEENNGSTEIFCGQHTVRLWPNRETELEIDVSREKCCNLVDYLGEPKDFDPVKPYCESLINN